MLQIVIPEREFFDEGKQEFIHLKRQVLQLEHSLISLSKWESKWKKPFIGNGKEQHDIEQTMDYIRCMTITQGVSPEVYAGLDPETLKTILDYISESQTATKIYDRRPGASRRGDTITSELIYYKMVYHGIPFECEKWPLSRLMTLIRICDIRGSGNSAMMSRQSILAQNQALNASRRRALHTRG